MAGGYVLAAREGYYTCNACGVEVHHLNWPTHDRFHAEVTQARTTAEQAETLARSLQP